MNVWKLFFDTVGRKHVHPLAKIFQKSKYLCYGIFNQIQNSKLFLITM